MSTTAKTVQLTQLIDDEITRLNPRTNGASVDIIREQNPNIPENITDIQSLINALGKLAFMNNISTTPPPQPCTNFKARAKSTAVELTWTDPEDYVYDGTTITWGSTRIVRKTGGYPSSENDGTVVTTSYVRNQYKVTPFVDEGLTNGTTYYYRAFSCTTDGTYNISDIVSAQARPSDFRFMTVTIDLNNPDPPTMGSYADDAVSMDYGKETEAINAWKDFFGYRPCLFKNGQVVDYLNPNDYTQFENGGSADITSGIAGDVMVEFPRRGVKISKVDKTLTISMTDDPDHPDYTYYAHTRGTSRRENFYLGVYFAECDGTRLYSVSGGDVKKELPLATFREYAHAIGSGYEVLTYYQWMYLQVMYCLQFRGNLNTQSALGIGRLQSIDNLTGKANYDGVLYGTTDPYDSTKLFGLEDIYCMLDHIPDGYGIDEEGYVVTATDNFNENFSGYTRQYQVSFYGTEVYGFISDVVGTSEVGFFPIGFDGSSSTYFSDMTYFASIPYPQKIHASVGGNEGMNGYQGMFSFYNDWAVGYGEDAYNTTSSVRISYY